jgi:hypothetical protein
MELYIHSPNMLPWHGALLKCRITLPFYLLLKRNTGKNVKHNEGGRGGGTTPCILNLGMNGGEWSALANLPLGNEPPHTH